MTFKRFLIVCLDGRVFPATRTVVCMHLHDGAHGPSDHLFRSRRCRDLVNIDASQLHRLALADLPPQLGEEGGRVASRVDERKAGLNIFCRKYYLQVDARESADKEGGGNSKTQEIRTSLET